jgi:hypothetical protein
MRGIDVTAILHSTCTLPVKTNNSNVPFANRKFAFRTARLFEYKRENLYNTTQGIRITPSNRSNLARTDRNRAKTAAPSQNTLLSEMASIKIAQTPISAETLAECLRDRTSGGILYGLHYPCLRIHPSLPAALRDLDRIFALEWACTTEML